MGPVPWAVNAEIYPVQVAAWVVVIYAPTAQHSTAQEHACRVEAGAVVMMSCKALLLIIVAMSALQVDQ